jgi:hypothetical protein
VASFALAFTSPLKRGLLASLGHWTFRKGPTQDSLPPSTRTMCLPSMDLTQKGVPDEEEIDAV